jgi:predicted DNA-binding transcriptional regulator AlpA
MDLVGTNEIAELLGVSRVWATQLTKRQGFPEPLATVSGRIKVWSRQAVVEWMNEHRYDVTPAPPA